MLRGLLRHFVAVGCIAVSTAWAEKPFEFHISPEMRSIAAESAQVEIDKSVQQSAAQSVKTVQSPEYQARVKAIQDSLVGAAGATFSASSAENAAKDSTNDDAITSSNSRVYLFVSSSLGKASLRSKVEEAAKLPNAVLVLRGFVGGAKTVTPTIKFIADILKKDTDCQGLQCELHAIEFNIDPIRFARYGITRVPAVVYEPNETFLGHCDGDALATKSDRLVVYGEASLQYALETMHDEQPTPGLPDLIAKLEPIPWEYRNQSGRTRPRK